MFKKIFYKKLQKKQLFHAVKHAYFYIYTSLFIQNFL